MRVRDAKVTGFSSPFSITWEITAPSPLGDASRSILLNKVMKRMQRSCQIRQELAIIVKKSQIRLQLCDIGRTLGLCDCIHLLREGTNAILVNPVSKKLEARLEQNAPCWIQPDGMFSSRIVKCSSGKLLEIRISSKQQTVNLTPCRS